MQRLILLGASLASGCVFGSRAALAQQAALAAESAGPAAAVQAAATAAITEAALRGHIRFLADDLLEGRGPGSRGDLLAQRYVAAQFEALGMQPAAPTGGWFQPVPLVGVVTHAPATITATAAAGSVELARHDEFVMTSGTVAASSSINDAELVFVGYGMVAPEYDWNDYDGVDVAGKVVIVMNNDPADDPDLFAGRRRLYYGRWDYKYAEAARQGAAGAIIIHTTPSAGYPYQVVQTSWSGEQFRLRETVGPQLAASGWCTEEAARRVLALTGHDLDALRAAAESRDFEPAPLGSRMSVELRNDVREIDTANVLGLLPGADPTLSGEMVVVMAHHDHLGLAAARDATGDNIYNGAVDNAAGVGALLALADAVARLPERPARSVLFTTVGAEEQGLLGSEYFAAHPPTAAGNLAAVVNIDGVNIIGPTHDVNVIGLGKSSLDALVQRVADWQGRVVTPDEFPDRGYYYRSDQFSLAKVGVPGVYLHSGVHVIDQAEGWGRRQLEEWIETKYHQPSDEYSDEWDLRGAVLDTQLLFHVAVAAADQTELPAWNAGDEFEAARMHALEQREAK